jgi:mediator of replication checkpoint protein 1
MDDLSDHEDDAAERRRKKQEDFARMRRALLSDEKIGRIAQNPKQQAFFYAIEDRDEFNGLDYIDRPEQESIPESQTEEAAEAAEDSDSSKDSHSLKRKLPDEFDDESVGKENVPPRNPRRTYADDSSKRPTSLAEIRESLSFFLEDSIVPDSQIDLSDHEEDSDLSLSFSFNRTDTNTSTDSFSSRTSVINRLVRTDSEDSMTSKPLAFQTGSAATGPTFKVPSLLRRATNLSTNSNSSTGTSNSSRSNESGVRMGGSRKSNIHYQAREAERKLVVDAADQKRKAQVKNKVMSSKGRSILGLLRKGDSGFE